MRGDSYLLEGTKIVFLWLAFHREIFNSDIFYKLLDNDEYNFFTWKFWFCNFFSVKEISSNQIWVTKMRLRTVSYVCTFKRVLKVFLCQINNLRVTIVFPNLFIKFCDFELSIISCVSLNWHFKIRFCFGSIMVEKKTVVHRKKFILKFLREMAGFW
jgi:hypothetical protein